jgi:leader peptidase (prepilin peptidase) / N-methyltransferase
MRDPEWQIGGPAESDLPGWRTNAPPGPEGAKQLPCTDVLEHLEPLASSPAAYVFVVVLGLLFGSFANVCIYRMPPSDAFPGGRSVVTPGSHCFACTAPIRWYDNVPLVAWLWLRGRCRACGAAFSARYVLVEAVTAALFGVAWWAAVVAMQSFATIEQRLLHFVVYAAFCFVMVVITFIDLDHKLILNKVTIPSVVVFYAVSLLWAERHWYDGLVGAAIGYGLPWVIGEIYYRITRREGLGLGDGMLLAVVGALLGWRGVLVALFGGSMIGSVLGIVALVIARTRAAPDEPDGAGIPDGTDDADDTDGTDGDGDGDGDADGTDGRQPSLIRTELPFGPFLAMAALFYLFAEPWFQLHFRLPGG